MMIAEVMYLVQVVLNKIAIKVQMKKSLKHQPKMMRLILENLMKLENKNSQSEVSKDKELIDEQWVVINLLKSLALCFLLSKQSMKDPSK